MRLTAEWKEQREKIGDLEDKTVEITRSEQQRGNRQKNEQRFRDLWHNSKRCNIHFIRVQEGKKKEGGSEKST